MFYCEPCRIQNNWPVSLVTSYGSCEVCGFSATCYSKNSSQLPLPKQQTSQPVRARDRIDNFLALFSEEEKASWAGKGNKAPDWVVRGITYFLGDDPGHQELMRRLKESGD